MAYLVAAVVGLTALSLFQLALTLGVVRRLRAQDAQLARLNETGGLPMTAIGQRVGAFEATATDGSTVRRDGIGRRTIAFFTPDCKACTQQLPEFVAYAAGFAGDVVAVVVADDSAQGWAYIEKVKDVARTVLEPTDG